jgi:hypothetical protein
LALDRLGDYQGERDALQQGVAALAPLHNQIGFLALQARQMEEAEIL